MLKMIFKIRLTSQLPALGWELRAGSWEPGAGSWEPGAGSWEPGAGSWEHGAGSWEPGLGAGTWFELGRTELSDFLDVVGELNECI